jgi:hypothetical protein
LGVVVGDAALEAVVHCLGYGVTSVVCWGGNVGSE